MLRLLAIVSVIVLASGAAGAADAPDLPLFRDIYKELVEINTTQGGDTVQAAEALAARLRAAGLPAADIHLLSSAPRKGILVARLRGTGAKKPILLIAHLDVVEAKRADWDFDPFKLQEVDGYFRGRGSIDDKAMAAIFTANLIRYLKEGYKPDRDIILALTTDEEIGGDLGAGWLVDNHRDLIDAELALNEGGGGVLKDGKPVRNTVQLAEKIAMNYRLEVKDPGGHSSLPRKENPIYRLSAALQRLQAYEFPAHLNDVTRAYFQDVMTTEEPATATAIKALLDGHSDAASLAPLSANVLYNAQIRTTCVATMLDGGHAENALPQTAGATVNCRILPDENVDEIARTLTTIIDDPNVSVTPLRKPVPSPPTALDPVVMGAIKRLTNEMWPGVPVMATMSTGATDSKWVRNIGMAAYGVSGLFSEPGKNGVHGLNE
ncbi:MAG: M20/M25/M40 family metallo-hydrolase, partial [Alphaproteobacteria bacterium]|nr:M20/M25/M40 family metallo-hydrolase [Alphaproteobacteria bacterium]